MKKWKEVKDWADLSLGAAFGFYSQDAARYERLWRKARQRWLRPFVSPDDPAGLKRQVESDWQDQRQRLAHYPSLAKLHRIESSIRLAENPIYQHLCATHPNYLGEVLTDFVSHTLNGLPTLAAWGQFAVYHQPPERAFLIRANIHALGILPIGQVHFTRKSDSELIVWVLVSQASQPEDIDFSPAVEAMLRIADHLRKLYGRPLTSERVKLAAQLSGPMEQSSTDLAQDSQVVRRQVTWDRFSNWLLDRGMRLLDQQLVADGGSFVLDRFRTLGNVPTVALEGQWVSRGERPAPIPVTFTNQRATLIQYDVAELDDSFQPGGVRSDVTSYCAPNIPALRQLFDTLEAEIEDRWPNLKNPLKTPKSSLVVQDDPKPNKAQREKQERLNKLKALMLDIRDGRETRLTLRQLARRVGLTSKNAERSVQNYLKELNLDLGGHPKT